METYPEGLKINKSYKMVMISIYTASKNIRLHWECIFFDQQDTDS